MDVVGCLPGPAEGVAVVGLSVGVDVVVVHLVLLRGSGDETLCGGGCREGFGLSEGVAGWGSVGEWMS